MTGLGEGDMDSQGSAAVVPGPAHSLFLVSVQGMYCSPVSVTSFTPPPFSPQIVICPQNKFPAPRCEGPRKAVAKTTLRRRQAVGLS